MKLIINLMPLITMGVCLLFSCSKTSGQRAEEPPIEIPEGDVTVAVYYFPNWGPVEESEWQTIKYARPQFPGHAQPKIPLWGYGNENDPRVMEGKIEAAAAHGIDAFIFDWYYYDRPYGKYLHTALEEGFLGAANNGKLHFALMWCNHDVGEMKGAVSPETFDGITDYVVGNYFSHPSYWLVDGCPYFSIYQVDEFLATFGGDYTAAAAGIERFREKVKAAGFPDLHLNVCLWSLGNYMEAVDRFGINSTTSYVWIHHNTLPHFPATEYSVAAENYFRSVQYGGGSNGLARPAAEIPVPYHINVTMGWDSSPRCRNAEDWMQRRDYPFGPVIVNNTPYLFKKYLARAKELTVQKPESDRIITINSWNEWGEGSYLEPDDTYGMEYLEAIKTVFGK